MRVLAGLALEPGDEVLTSDEEHPGLLGPLAAARAQRGIAVREVPFAELAGAVAAATKLVACSHVSWVNGRLAPDLSRLDVPVLLDGAQGAGAIPVDVAALGCDVLRGVRPEVAVRPGRHRAAVGLARVDRAPRRRSARRT